MTQIIINEYQECELSTNSMTIPNLKSEFFETENLIEFEEKIKVIAPIKHFCPLKGFNRLLIITDEDKDEDFSVFGNYINTLKRELDNTIFKNFCIKCYLLEPINLKDLDENYLKVHKSERLMLISPPSSPPSGWISQLEDPPNSQTFSIDMLTHALNQIKLKEKSDEKKAGNEDNIVKLDDNYLILDMGNDLPTIHIEDYDEELKVKNNLRRELPKTSFPCI